MREKRLQIYEDSGVESTMIKHNLMVEVVQDHSGDIRVDGGLAVEVRGSGEFEGKALYLRPEFDWVKGVDSAGLLCLVPLRREKA